MALSKDFEERQKMRQRQRRIEREKRKKLQKLWLILFGVLVILIVVLCISRCNRNKVGTVVPAASTEEAITVATPTPTETTAALMDLPAPSVGNNDLLNLIKASGQVHHVYLTFDEGPDPNVTPKILDALRRYDAKATFFVTGRDVEQYPYLVTRMIDEGHLVLPLSYSGNPDRLYADKNDFIDEVNKTYELICDNSPIASNPVKIYRFIGGGGENTTYGSAKQNYKTELAKNGYYFCDWNTTIGDETGSRSAEQLVQYFKDYRPELNNLVIRMCNTDKNANTAEALGTIINDLLGEGYIFSRLDQIDGAAAAVSASVTPDPSTQQNESVTVTAEPAQSSSSTPAGNTATTAPAANTSTGNTSSASSGSTSGTTSNTSTGTAGTRTSGTTQSGTSSTSTGTHTSGTTSTGTASSGSTSSSGTSSAGTSPSTGNTSSTSNDFLIPE